MFSASIFFVEINCHSERQRRISIVKMLHFVQHDSEASSKILLGNDINDYTNCHSERQRRIFIIKMLHFVQHDSEWMISEVQTDISLPKYLSDRSAMEGIAEAFACSAFKVFAD